MDDRFNPVSIRVTYETDDTFDGGGTKTWVAGLDATVRVARGLDVGGGLVDDRTPDAPYQLRS